MLSSSEALHVCAFAHQVLCRGLQVRVDPIDRIVFACFAPSAGGVWNDQIGVGALLAIRPAELPQVADAFADRIVLRASRPAPPGSAA